MTVHNPSVDDGLDVEQIGPMAVVLRSARENPAAMNERTFMNRSEAALILAGIPIRVDMGTKANDPWLNLDEEVRFTFMTEADIDPQTKMPRVIQRKGKPFVIRSRYAEFAMSGAHTFATTTKMSAASWSIPAGPQTIDGTCAAAELFKHTKQYQVALQAGIVEDRAPDPTDWICAYCYAGKSNYMHRQSQYSQLIRWIFLKGLVSGQSGIDGTAVVFSEMLKKHLGNTKKRDKVGENPKFFRIHDSGDFTLVPNTYLMWRDVARELSDVSFWAPTRMWVFPKFNEIVRRNPPPRNLAIRPSALHFNDRAPEIEGFQSMGSTAHSWETKEGGRKIDPLKTKLADWICPAYQHDGHSCAGGGGPGGEKDCRACWKYPDLRISYRSH